MEIKLIRRSGVPLSERTAFQDIQAALNATPFSRGWKGYASFKLVRKGPGTGDEDFDLVLITHSTIAVIELKNRRGKKLTQVGNNWYVDGEDQGETPVRLVAEKARRLASRLNDKLGRSNVPFVSSYVVVSGIQQIDMTEEESQSVMLLEDLLKWNGSSGYETWVKKTANYNVLTKLRQYDGFFGGGREVKPRDYLVEGFQPAETPIWIHPKGLYSEFEAKAKDDKDQLALLRRWKFDALGTQLIGEQDRSFLALREQRVYEYVEERNSELQSALLRPISRKESKHVTMDFAELFSLPTRLVRLTEFANSTLPKLDPDERVRLVKSLLTRFADLHDLRVAHRDIGEHNLWIERPAQVVVSGFPAAYFPSMGTVGQFRDQVKVERSKLPEDTGASAEHTPYTRDVFLLGVTCYQILFGQRPPKVAEVYGWATVAADPYSGALDGILIKAMSVDPKDRFSDAREMLNAFNKMTSRAESEIIDLARFEAFKANTKAGNYVESQTLLDDDDVHFYRSTSEKGDFAVKVWLGIEPDKSKHDVSIRLLGFLERARTLRGCAVPGMPNIQDFGLTRRSLMLVRDWVEGVTLHSWIDSNPSLEQRVGVARALTGTLARLHALELAHGDVHPGNVVIDAQGSPIFLDALDFVRSADVLCTTAYLPADYKAMGPFQRDRYGLAAVLVEVFGATQDAPTGALAVPKVYEQLELLLKDRQACSLEPLQTALERALEAPHADDETFALQMPLSHRNLPDGPLHLDNGVLHIRVTQDPKRSAVLRFKLTGVGRQLNIDWDVAKERAVSSSASAVTQSMLFRLQLERDADVPVKVTLSDGPPSDFSGLVRFLLADAHIAARVGRLLAIQQAKATAGEPAQDETEEKSEQIEGETVEDGDLSPQEDAAIKVEGDDRLPAPITEVWRALMDAEEDALPTLAVAGPHRPNPSDRSQILLPCHMESEDIVFESREAVSVENLGRDKLWHRYGRLNQKETTFGEFTELAIEDVNMKASLRIGDKIRLRGQLEKSSFSRRTLAVQRILNGRAVVPNLIEYFDPSKSAALPPTQYSAPSDSDLDEYSEGDKKLNDSQKHAFRQVLSNGPISLVQGPPGTGKTWFIAALLHFLMTKDQARRILLVSQSNEAVNNALEKALELCRSKGLEFNAVRLGREEFASDSIRHLHESSIEQGYREQFKAEREDRIVELARIMGLPVPFSRAFVSLQGHLGKLVLRIQKLVHDAEFVATDGERQGLAARRQSLVNTFETICNEVYEVNSQDDPTTTLARMEEDLIRTHEINADDAVERLRKLVRLSDDWQSALGSPHANFAEFLAKSRTVVAGTLVGIGHFASGVVENLYDWVIIDEAARAAPSELSVAMQTGRRILLVGDHLQLPPTFSREVMDTVQRRFSVGEESKVFASDFERVYESAYGQSVGASLLTQYRMAPNIGRLVSDCFYDKRLKTGRGPSPAYYSMLPDFMGQEVTWVDTASAPNAREKHSDNRDEYWNDGEARVVMALLQHIVESEGFLEKIRGDLQPGEPAIGIICMYSKQRDILDGLKSKASWLGDARRLVKIDTVDSYQGKENRIVILSTVRTDRPGFLKKFNRVNVGLSRAMERLFIVGATKLWEGRNSDLPLGSVLKKVREMEREEKACLLQAKEVLQ